MEIQRVQVLVLKYRVGMLSLKVEVIPAPEVAQVPRVVPEVDQVPGVVGELDGVQDPKVEREVDGVKQMKLC